MNMPRFLHSRIATLKRDQPPRYSPQALLAAQPNPSAASTG
jgi:hypothetical protein